MTQISKRDIAVNLRTQYKICVLGYFEKKSILPDWKTRVLSILGHEITNTLIISIQRNQLTFQFIYRNDSKSQYEIISLLQTPWPG